jgi:hypothetical protein
MKPGEGMSEYDTTRVVALMDEMLGILRKYEGRMSVAEVQARSILSVLRDEFALRARGEMHGRSISPFSGHPFEGTADMAAH